MEQGKSNSPRGSASGGVRWWWVLGTGAGVGVFSCLLLVPVIVGYFLILSLLDRDVQSSVIQFATAYGAWGMPAIHTLLIAFAAAWLARKVGAAAVTHGVLAALVSVVVVQAIFSYVSPPFDLGEAATYLVMATAGGLLGGLEGRNVLAGQEALYRVSRDTSAARDPQDVLAAIHAYLAGSATIGAALWQAPVRVEDSPNGSGDLETWRPWFSRDWPDGVGFDGLDVLALAGSGRSASWTTLRPGRLSPTERAACRKRGVRSVLLLPLVAPAGGIIGLLAVASRKKRIPRSTVRACLTIGVQAALALENLRLVEEARNAGRQAGILRERQRMAYEIHDTLAQGFTSIVMNLEAAEGVIPSNLDRAQHHLDQARLTARESLTEARRLVWALRPEALENVSLPEALGRLAERWAGESGISAGVSTTGTPCPL
ncbi:MAG: histidine kinase, partial [Actinomycetota bacterium]|nr:histidine kinase [Actinomycetota bacterium]